MITLSALVCFAVKEEARAARLRLGGRRRVETLVTGMGRQNAERAVRRFLETRRPALVLSCGFAGGLNPKLQAGDVLFLTVDPALDGALVGAGAKPATFFCAPRIAATAAEKAELRRATGADAVEMESEAIHGVCRERGIPCATVRVISDAADEDLPLDFNALLTPAKRMNYFKLAGALLKSPGKVGALLRLQKQSGAVAEALALVLAKVIPA